MDIATSELKKAVELMHHCMARPVLSVPVGENHGSTTVWEGVVHVFDLTGHPTATTAYAWSSRTEGSDTRRFFAVLHLPPITSPAEAVRAAIASLKRNIGRPSSATNRITRS